MWLLLTLACAPGFLRTRDGREPLRAAWFGEVEGELAEPSLTVLLSNSDLLCELPDTEDPGELDEALSRQAAGFYREGAKVLMFNLASTEPGWTGTYALTDASEGLERPARTASAIWWEVVEAEVETQDGILVSYTPGDAPGDYVFVPRVPTPGTVEVTSDESLLTGEFILDGLDISGSFEADPCDADAALFASLGYSF